VFVIRERLARPQVLATSRHITGGGVDLVDVSWDGTRLAGRSRVVGGDPYDVYVTVPAGFTLGQAVCAGVPAKGAVREAGIARFTCLADTNLEIEWSVSFRRE
jgi:hypothetical protein